MKKIIIVLISTCLFADVKETIKLMHILDNFDFSYKPITTLYNPFRTKVITSLPSKNSMNNSFQTYKLEVVFQNRVRINGNWYNIGDKIDDFIIKKDGNKICLKNSKQKIILTPNSLIKVK